MESLKTRYTPSDVDHLMQKDALEASEIKAGLRKIKDKLAPNLKAAQNIKKIIKIESNLGHFFNPDEIHSFEKPQKISVIEEEIPLVIKDLIIYHYQNNIDKEGRYRNQLCFESDGNGKVERIYSKEDINEATSHIIIIEETFNKEPYPPHSYGFASDAYHSNTLAIMPPSEYDLHKAEIKIYKIIK